MLLRIHIAHPPESKATREERDPSIGELQAMIAGLTERLHQVEVTLAVERGHPEGDASVIAVTALKGFCAHGGRIFTHETGYCRKGASSSDRSMLYVPTPSVEENREIPPEAVESLFAPLGNRQRVILLRSLGHETPMGAGTLRDATGLTEGSSITTWGNSTRKDTR